MAVSILQTASLGSGSTTVSATFASTPTVGNLMVAAVAWNHGAGQTVATPTGWTALDSLPNGSGVQLATFYRKVQSGDGKTITFTMSAGCSCLAAAWEIQGNDATAFINQHVIATFASTTAPTSPSATGSVIGCLPLAIFAPGNIASETFTASGVYLLDGSKVNGNNSIALTHNPTDTTDTTTAQSGAVTLGLAAIGVASTLLIAPLMTLSVQALNFETGTSANQTATVSGGSGGYTATSSNTAIATVSVSGTTVTVTPVAVGTCTITVKDSNLQAQTITVNVGIILSPSTVNFTAATGTADVAVSGGNGTYNAVSNNTAVCTVVVNGSTVTITPSGAGSTTVSVTDTSTAAAATITVNVPSGNIGLSVSPMNFQSSASATQTFTATETGFTSTITATSNNTSIATVSPASGTGPGPITFTVTPVASGTTSISLQDTNGNLSTLTVNVGGVVTLTPNTISFNLPTSPSQTVAVTEPGYTQGFATSSSDYSIAAITITLAGTMTITPLNPGTATVTVTDIYGYNSNLTITVDAPLTTSVSELSFVGSALGQYQRFTASKANYTGTISAVSSNTAIATVSPASGSGPGPLAFSVTSVGQGTCNITVTDTVGGSSVIVINVIRNITVSPTSLTFTSSTAAAQTAAISGGTPGYTAVSSDTTKCTVSVAGTTLTVTPVGVGTATVTITDQSVPALSATLSVTVLTPFSASPTSFIFNSTTSPTQTSTVAGGTTPYTATSNNTAICTVSVSGSTVTITPVGIGSTTITVKDSTSPQQSLTLNVTVTATFAVTPLTVKFLTPTSANQTVAVSGGTPPYKAGSSNKLVCTVPSAGPTTTISPAGTGTATVTVQDSNAESIPVTVTVLAPYVVVPTSVRFLSPTALSQTCSVSGGTSPYTASTSNSAVATASVSGGIVTITPAGVGTCTITLTDSTTPTAQTLTVSVTVLAVFAESPTSLSFVSSTSGSQTVTISGGTSPYTVTSQNAGVASASIIGGTLTVTPVGAGVTTVTIQDSTSPTVQTLILAVTVLGGLRTSLLLKFTGFVDTDANKMDPFAMTKSVSLISLSKQFRFPIYDTLPHPLYGNQTLAYFDPTYNLTNPSGDGKTWVCDGKMFTQTSSDPVFGSAHMDPDVYVDTTGGNAPSSVPVTKTGFTISNNVGTCTNYTFDYHNGTVTFTAAGLTALGYGSGLPAASVVSVKGNPTYMAPEVMIRKLLVEKAAWSPLFLQLDSSNVLLPQFVGENQTLWTCLQQIANLTCPRFVPWVLTTDEAGVVKFYENRVDGPPVKTFVDERDILSCVTEQSARALRTVVRADGAVSTSSGDQPVTSISYDLESINKYGQTEALSIAKEITMSVRHLTPVQAVAYLNMLTAGVLAAASRPTLSLKCEVWPDPSLQTSDKIRVRSKRLGTDREYIIRAIDSDIKQQDYKQVLQLEEFYDPINFMLGLPSGVSTGNTQASVTAAPSTSVIGAIQMGTYPIYPFQYGQYVKNPQTQDQIVPYWDMKSGASMQFNVFLNTIPSSGTPPTQSSTASGYNYYNRPPSCNWTRGTDPLGNLVWYGTSPGGSGFPPSGYTVYVGPDSIFYSFNHASPILPADFIVANRWYPSTNQNPALGASQTYIGQATTAYLWMWWYLCLDSTLGVGKQYRLVQRVNTSIDGAAQAVPATGGLWVNNTWTNPPGMSQVSSQPSHFYGNLVAGITDYTTPPYGFVGANVMGSTPAVNYGVGFGPILPLNAGTYVNYQKKTKGHFCVLAANNLGAVQFLRVPFYLYL